MTVMQIWLCCSCENHIFLCILTVNSQLSILPHTVKKPRPQFFLSTLQLRWSYHKDEIIVHQNSVGYLQATALC